jgi:kynureninase
VARRRDGADPLASFQSLFAPTADGVRYLDGNSLGRLPRATISAVTHAMEHEWQTGLVRSWNRWIDLPVIIGDELAPLIGAPHGSVLITDQTSLNIYKIGTALLRRSGRGNIVSDSTNFPSDLYVLSGIAAAAGGELRVIEADPGIGCTPRQLAAALDDTIGLVELSHITFKTGAVAPMAELTEVAHNAGSSVLWDLAHSAGVFPVDVATTAIDAAIGCTYKHLNAGPGAPGFLYVRPDLISQLRQPIQGWWGHADPFAFDGEYQPVADIRRFGVGTQPILSMVGVREGVRLSARAGIETIRQKSIDLTDFVIQFFDTSLAGLGFTLATPRDGTLRGAHVAINHPEAYQVSQALIAANVVPDFRAPDTLRIGIAPLANSYVEVYEALETLREIVATGAHRAFPVQRAGVS